MYNHLRIATEGVTAGHRHFARLGFGYSVEIIVTPGGGGGPVGPKYIPDFREYYVTVKIRKGSKVWVKKINATQFEIKTLEKVIITFKSIGEIASSVYVGVVHKSINIKNTLIKVFRNKDKP